MPKPPPTRGEMQRIFVSGIPNTKAVIRSRMTCGHCEVIQTVYSPVAGSYSRDGAARLERRRQQSLVDEALLDDDLRFLQRLVGRVGVAAVPVEGDVARCRLVQLRRSFLDRPLRVDDDLERFPVDVDQAQRVLCRHARLRDHGRNAGARERDTVDLERARRGDEVLDAARLPCARQRVELLEVLAGVYADHAGTRGGLARVDRLDARVGVRGAQDRPRGQCRAA